MSQEHIVEEDETGRACRRYTGDTVLILDEERSKGTAKSILQTLSDVFMPAGFPASVSSDYFEYQLYDSLQAFSSSIAGLLASRAVLEGVGVGDANASATGALLLTITQDAVSRLATILFAWRIGTALEPEAKRYRLLADFFNDGAMILDCLSPALPKHLRILSLCLSGSLRALCGVAAGGAKAALSVHFARANNVGDLNAKDSSQETVIGLLGMLAGSLVVSRVTSQTATWTLLLILLAVHLSTNYLAVRAITMSTLSRQRANLVYVSYRSRKTVHSPSQVSKLERIFELGGVLRAEGRIPLGRCDMGTRLDHLFPVSRKMSRSTVPTSLRSRVLDIFAKEEYILWFSGSPPRLSTHPSYGICLKKRSRASDQLKAWFHVIELAHMIRETDSHPQPDGCLELLRDSLRKVNDDFPSILRELVGRGWDVDSPALMTRPSFRISTATWEGQDEWKKTI